MEFAIFGKHLFTDLAFKLKAHNQKESKKAFKIIEKNQNKYYFVGYIQYEFHKYLEDKNYQSKEPFLYFFAYKTRKKFSNKTQALDFYPQFTRELDQEQYFQNFEKVKQAIAKGQSYQVNLTQELHLQSNLNMYESFLSLYSKQDTPYKAYMKNEFLELASFSPELFFKIKNNKITTKPMKGTIKRSSDPEEDENFKAFLKQDEKTISENVMIVDLLRNDISKLIKKNSLKCKLFEVKTYPTLHQLISKISGTLKPKSTYFKIFKALFPCGSITGAPKLETIKLIQSLEQRERGIYCGAIGLIHKNKAKFSVAIRTLEQKNHENHLKYGVGSGLVWDSQKQDELEELKLKSKILKPDFYLFETMYYKDHFVLFFKEHLTRLLNSAKFFDFNTQKIMHDFKNILTQKDKKTHFKSLQSFNEAVFNKAFFLTKSHFNPKGQKALKLKLFKNGSYELEFSDLHNNPSTKILLSKDKLKPTLLTHHKTSLRSLYQAHAPLWQKHHCYDVVFFNDQNLLCEGSRTNIIVKIHNEYFTPYAKHCLNGIYRQALLKHKLIKEKNITQDELLNAEEIYAINSLRGLKRVFI